MNLIQNILQNWSIYEISIEILLLLSILCVCLFTIYLSTKNRKILLLSLLSLSSLFLTNGIGIFLSNLIFKVHISEIFRIIPIISLIFLISNLGLLTGFYSSKKDAKGFKIYSIRKEYLSDSIKQTVFLLLLGISTLLFLSPQTEVIVAISILSAVFCIWFTYWLSRYILR